MKNNTKSLIVLMFVMFSFFLGISSVQAKMSDQECKQLMDAKINEYKPIMTKEAVTKQDELDSARAGYEIVKYLKSLLDQGCADSPHFKEEKINLTSYKSVIANIKKECLEIAGREDCGSKQAPINSTPNIPKANNTASVKSTSSTNDAAEASKILASFGTSSQSKSCLRQKPRGDQLEISDTCPSPNRHVSTELFYCLVGIKDPKRNDAECGGPKFTEWVNGPRSDEAHTHGLREIRNKSSITVSGHGAKKLMMTACRTPYTPTNISYSPQGGLTSECRWCDKWEADGKHTCRNEIKTLQNN